VQVWGEFFPAGSTYRFDFQSEMETSTEFFFFGGFPSSCPYTQDLAAIGEIHFLWTVDRPGRYSFTPFHCEGNGRAEATATFFGEEVLSIAPDCDEGVYSFFQLREGDTVAFDVRLNETRDDSDSLLSTFVYLRLLPEPQVSVAPATEIGANDFRMSDMGPDGDVNFAGGISLSASWNGPAVAYNSNADEYLAVWMGDDGSGEQVDEEYEIYGQRLDAFTGAAVGSNDFRISEMGPDGDASYIARHPAAAYNPNADEYLVVWGGDGGVGALADDGREIHGQRLDASTGAEVGTNDFRISDMGPDGNADINASLPSVAYNARADEYLVVWLGDDDSAGLADNEFEIFGQRLNASTGAEVGTNDFRISDMGPDGNSNFGAIAPAVAYNSTADEYLVVWYGDDDVGGGREIHGQRLDGSTGTPIGVNDFRISDMVSQALVPAVTYNPTVDEYLVVWEGGGPGPAIEYEIYAQRLDGSTGAEVGVDDFRISDMGPEGRTAFWAAHPAVAYNLGAEEYLVIWHGNDDDGSPVDGEVEIFGQRIDGTTGAEIGANDFRISDMGPDGDSAFRAAYPALPPHPRANDYLAIWEGDNNTGNLVDDEVEVFGQLIYIPEPDPRLLGIVAIGALALLTRLRRRPVCICVPYAALCMAGRCKYPLFRGGPSLCQREGGAAAPERGECAPIRGILARSGAVELRGAIQHPVVSVAPLRSPDLWLHQSQERRVDASDVTVAHGTSRISTGPDRLTRCWAAFASSQSTCLWLEGGDWNRRLCRDEFAVVRLVAMRRLRLFDEVRECCREPLRHLDVEEVARVVEDLEPTPFDTLGGCIGVLDGDDVIAVAPEDQGRDGSGQVESIVGADRLPARVDHGAHRADERVAVLRFGQRCIGAPHLGDVRSPQAAVVQECPEDVTEVANEARADDRQQEFGAGQCKQAENPAHFATESPTAGKHQPLAELRVLVGELHRDSAAERLPDHGGAIDPQCTDEQIADPARMRTQRIIAHRLRGLAMPEKVGRNDRVVACKIGHDAQPSARATCHPMNQQNDGTLARHPVAHTVAMEGRVLDAQIQVGHGSTVSS
jgi:hypothetical protein